MVNDGVIYCCKLQQTPQADYFLPVPEGTQIANRGISQLPALGSHEASWRHRGDRVSKQLLHS